ncbi:hypothetical protein NDU88_007730 [Pleurodeles waltl]|uniref:Uncharacterized protein n=1 Tax=Pleurodeles waltl TaxID=8319 RepID=A0AAV7RQY4_PLEWA|nr:hypothetical protein NDU88_007730 [Pleurodeles waltl]
MRREVREDRSAKTDESQEEKRSRTSELKPRRPRRRISKLLARFRRSVATSGAFRDQLRGARKDPEEPMEIGLMKAHVLWSGGKRPTYTLKVYLNDVERTALVDSGCSQSVIQQNLVLLVQRTPQSQVLITCVHGNQLPYPVAMVRLNWRGDDETITVGVIPDLGEDLILGTDYVDFISLLEKASQEHGNNAWCEEAPFGASEDEVRTPRIKLSRKQKREQRREHRNFHNLRNLDPAPHTATIFTTTGEFRQAEHEDPTLKNAWHQALHPDGQLKTKEEVKSQEKETKKKTAQERHLYVMPDIPKVNKAHLKPPIPVSSCRP